MQMYMYVYMAYYFIPILLLLPFVLSLFYVYSIFIYFAIPVTVDRHAESPAQAHQVGGSTDYTLPQFSGQVADDRRQ